MTKIRTRFAPSPTGRMHVGNLRTALYAYLITKHEGGDFILRIEDTDQERYVEGAVDIIYRTLEKTGLIHDEGPDKDGGFGPYVQSERQATGMYLKYAKQLIEQGDAYYCFCGKEELESMKRTVAGKEISIYDKRCLHLSKEEVQRRLDAETFKALSDPVRREILQLLKNGKMSAGEIGGHFDMTGATISYHLKILKKADLVWETKVKNFVYYELNTTVVEELLLWLSDLKGGNSDER